MAELKLALGAVADIASGEEIKDGVDKILKSMDKGKHVFPKYFKRIGAGTSAASGDLLLDCGGPVVGEIWDVRALAVIQSDPWTIGTSTTPIQTPAAAQATGAASAIAPTFGGAAGTTAFITGFQITGLGATGSSVITVTLTGVLGGTISYDVPIPAGTTTSITPVYVTFPGAGLQASGAAQAITLNVPSFGTGNTFSSAAIQGYTQTALANSAVTKAGVYIGQGFASFAANSSTAPTNELEDAGQSLPYTVHYVTGQLWVLYPNHLYVVIHNPAATTQYNAIARLVQEPSHRGEIA